MLKQKLLNKRPGIITYGMTPPKLTTSPEKIEDISRKQYERLKNTGIDGLILYDVQEEADRTNVERPFPYLPTIDPAVYGKQYLGRLDVPKIVYRCVGKYSEAELADWIDADREQERFSVFVGASSSKQNVTLSLTESYRICQRLNPNLIFGGVVIPERHMKRRDEHIRIADKAANGCKFFVSQAIYNVEASKNMLSDYYYYCREHEIEMVPILFNFAPCGSQKTLDFMKWLGISIPHWLENELQHSGDILDTSIRQSKKIFEELFDFGLEKGIPVGCSIESVSTRKVEIEASVQLTNDLKAVIDKKIVGNS